MLPKTIDWEYRHNAVASKKTALESWY